MRRHPTRCASTRRRSTSGSAAGRSGKPFCAARIPERRWRRSGTLLAHSPSAYGHCTCTTELGARVLLFGRPIRAIAPDQADLRMKRLTFAFFVLAAACGPRQVEVRTAAPLPAENALQVTNSLQQAVNVYVTYNGTDQFIQQVRPGTSLRLPVRGIPAGSTVTLKAITVDGTRTYSHANIVLNGVYTFPIP